MSVDIYRNPPDYLTDPKSVQVRYRPVWVYRREHGNVPDVPTIDKSTFEYGWWKEQIRRCMFGWVCPDDGKFISGYHYFYMNFCKVKYTIPWIKDQVVNEYDYPLYRDNDDIIFSILWNNRPGLKPNGERIPAKSHVEGKGRRKGWTTNLYGLFMHDFIFQGKGGLIGCAFPEIQTLNDERQEFKMVYEYLDPIFKRWGGVDLIVAKDSEAQFSIGEKIGNNRYIIHSTFLFAHVGSKESTDVFRGKKFYRLGVSEAGMWGGDTLIKFYSANKDSMGLGDRIFGSFVVGGTSDMINNTSVDYKMLFTDHKRFGFTRHFTPAYMVYEGHFDYFTGKSNIETAKASLESKRKLLEENERLYRQEVLENPLKWEEAFDPTQNTIYSYEILDKYIADIKDLRRDRMWKRFKLEYDYDYTKGRIDKTKVRPVHDPKGPWHIDTSCPVGKNNRFENLYLAGIDDVRLNRVEGAKKRSGDSKNAMVIWIRDMPNLKIPTNKPAALYLDDPINVTDAYEEFLKGMIYFNLGKANTLYEYNNPAFEMFLKDRKQAWRLFYTGSNQPGLRVGNDTNTDYMTVLGKEKLMEGVFKNIDYALFIEELKLWRLRNTDVSSALHLIWYLMQWKSEVMVKAVDAANDYTSNYILPEMMSNGGYSYSIKKDTSKYIQPWIMA